MVSIIEVTTKAQLRQFVEYPNILYKDVPQFVPATFDDDMSDWNRKKNPAFEYCEARCWLAMRNGEMVGRIGAILSRKANEKWHTNRMRFTQVDFIDDEQVANAHSTRWSAGQRKWAATRSTDRWALPTLTGRACWWRVLTAAAAFSPTITTPTISIT